MAHRKIFLALAVFLFALFSISDIYARANTKPSSDVAGDGRVTFYRPDKNERGTFVYRDKNGRLDAGVFEEIAYFFRCRLTNEVHSIDPRLIERLDAIQHHFKAAEVRLISTYRSPTRNALMRRQGRGVARDSLHMRGMAADIEIAGVSATAIRDYAFGLHEGGVGYYGRDGFVHVDSGSARTWGWRPPIVGRTAAAKK